MILGNAAAPPAESDSAKRVEPEAAALTTPVKITHPLDVVVIGASLGGVSALQKLVRELPEDLPAAILIVLHIARTAAYLASILDRAGSLPAGWAGRRMANESIEGGSMSRRRTDT